MGKELEKVALSRGHEIVCIIDINNQDDFESEAFRSADVAIEFTNPMAFAIQIFKNAFGQSDGGSAWCIEFVNMVRFTHSHVVCRKLVHNLCQVFVDGGENGYSQAEIRRPEQGLSLFLAKFFYLVTMLGHPSGAALNQFYTGFEGSDIVTVGYHRKKLCVFLRFPPKEYHLSLTLH